MNQLKDIECNCFENVKKGDFTACCSEHQIILDKVKEALLTVVQNVLTKIVIELIDDDETLSAKVIH
jgi:hypothetical protein